MVTAEGTEHANKVQHQRSTTTLVTNPRGQHSTRILKLPERCHVGDGPARTLPISGPGSAAPLVTHFQHFL